LEAENRELRARLNQNSGNSSRPPSSDPPQAQAQRRKKPPTGRKPGGQLGHPGYKRSTLPEKQVDEFVPVYPQQCTQCGCRLKGKGRLVSSHQVTEIPKIKPKTTEYQQYGEECPCGKFNVGALPEGVPKGNFGPGVMGMVGYMSGRLRLAKRVIRDALGDMFGVELSVGTVSNIEKKLSVALEKPYQKACRYVKNHSVRHADETGWREGKKKAWLWLAATPLVTVFLISLSRGRDTAKAMLGTGWGYLITDRWNAYGYWAVKMRQLCWSHLKRDFEGFMDRGKPAARIGKKLLREVDNMFGLWHRVRDGTLARSTFQRKMRPIRRRVERLLRKGARCAGPSVPGKCKQILKLAPALWTFVRVKGIEPTNNFGERQIRHAVQYRKVCFGTHSPEGSRFVERMLTTIMTLRQQNRNVLDYLTLAACASILGKSASSLLPSPTKRAAA